MTMAMFAGIALAAPFIILPVIRWLAVPVRGYSQQVGGWRRTRCSPTRSLPPPPSRSRSGSVVVVNSSMSSSFIGTINDQIGKAFARATSPSRHRASRSSRAGARRAALGPDSHRGDARDGHGRAAEGDAARPPCREERIEARPGDRGRPGEAGKGGRHRVPGRQPFGGIRPGARRAACSAARMRRGPTSSAATPSTSSARPGGGARR